MRNNLVLIDGNNLLHRSYHKFSNMKGTDGTPSGIVYGFSYVLRALIKLHKPTDLLVAFDGGKDKNRMALLPNYKQRERKEDFDADDFYRQRDATLEILKFLGVPFVFKKGLEADDIIWLYARRYKRTHHVILVSTDKDFHQLLSKNLSIWNPHKKLRITHKNLHKHYPYTPAQCVDYLSLDGDKSDNVPGYPGVGPVTAMKFLNEYGSIKEYLLSDCPEHSKIKKKELEELYLCNRVLIDIRLFCRRFIKLKDVPLKNQKGKKIKAKKLRDICITYSITTFTKPDFQEPFKKLLE